MIVEKMLVNRDSLPDHPGRKSGAGGGAVGAGGAGGVRGARGREIGGGKFGARGEISPWGGPGGSQGGVPRTPPFLSKASNSCKPGFSAKLGSDV